MTNDKAADLFKALAAKAGFSEDQVKLALDTAEYKELENRLPRPEYSRAMDRVRDLEPLATKAKEWDEWWTKKGGSTLFEKASQLSRYQERFGDLDPNNSTEVRQAANATGLTMEQVNALVEARTNDIGVRFSQMTNELLAIQVDAANRGVKLTGDDVLAMNKLMQEKGVTYAGAYEMHVGPRVREMEQTRLSKEKEDYAAEKVRDALSRVGHNAPLGSDPSVPNFFDRPQGGMADKPKSDQELLAMWNDAGQAVANRGRAA